LRIKAQGLLNAAKWIDEEYGHAALRDVLRGCSAQVRDRYTSVIAIDWHPVGEFVEFVRAAETLLGAGRPPGRIAEAIGAAGARANMKGTLVRFAVWIGRPEHLVARAAGLWRQFNDEGAMELREIGDQLGRFELTGVKGADPLFCSVLTGWFREIGVAVGAVNSRAKHVECKGRGGARCVWEVRYARVEQKGGAGVPPALE
jgi:hypothetical protein